jgi:acetolactate synthase-1/2/3 large subunit
MVAFDVMRDYHHYYGFLGAYGTRTANFIVAKSDLIISLGTRLDIRQVGIKRDQFAPNAKIIRFDNDEGELTYKVHEDEKQICADISIVSKTLEKIDRRDYSVWLKVCDEIKSLLLNVDENNISTLVRNISEKIPDEAIITTDVGQNQVWVAQSFQIKPNQKVLFSGGYGAMGYSLPAAIGAYYGSGKKHVFCITGDGGLQMNIQELQFIARGRLPIKIIVLNNNALGMIRHFQEMYFDSRFVQTKPEGGYTAPDFKKVAEAYGIKASQMEAKYANRTQWTDGAELKEYLIHENTYVTPKLEFGKPNQDQEPLIDWELYKRIMEMSVDNFNKLKCGGYRANRKESLYMCALPVGRCAA